MERAAHTHQPHHNSPRSTAALSRAHGMRLQPANSPVSLPFQGRGACLYRRCQPPKPFHAATRTLQSVTKAGNSDELACARSSLLTMYIASCWRAPQAPRRARLHSASMADARCRTILTHPIAEPASLRSHPERAAPAPPWGAPRSPLPQETGRAHRRWPPSGTACRWAVPCPQGCLLPAAQGPGQCRAAPGPASSGRQQEGLQSYGLTVWGWQRQQPRCLRAAARRPRPGSAASGPPPARRPAWAAGPPCQGRPASAASHCAAFGCAVQDGAPCPGVIHAACHAGMLT